MLFVRFACFVVVVVVVVDDDDGDLGTVVFRYEKKK